MTAGNSIINRPNKVNSGDGRIYTLVPACPLGSIICQCHAPRAEDLVVQRIAADRTGMWLECREVGWNVTPAPTMQRIVFLEFEKARLTLVPALLSIALDGKAPTCRRSPVSAPFGVPKLGLRSKFILRHRAPDLIILQTIIECSSGKNIEACLEGGPFEDRLTTARAIFGSSHLLSLA